MAIHIARDDHHSVAAVMVRPLEAAIRAEATQAVTVSAVEARDISKFQLATKLQKVSI